MGHVFSPSLWMSCGQKTVDYQLREKHKTTATTETVLIIIPLKHLQLGSARSLLTHPRSWMYSTATLQVFLGSKLLFWMQKCRDTHQVPSWPRVWSAWAVVPVITLSRLKCNCVHLLHALPWGCVQFLWFDIYLWCNRCWNFIYYEILERYPSFFFFFKMFFHLLHLKATVEQLSLYWNAYKVFQ